MQKLETIHQKLEEMRTYLRSLEKDHEFLEKDIEFCCQDLWVMQKRIDRELSAQRKKCLDDSITDNRVLLESLKGI